MWDLDWVLSGCNMWSSVSIGKKLKGVGQNKLYIGNYLVPPENTMGQRSPGLRHRILELGVAEVSIL